MLILNNCECFEKKCECVSNCSNTELILAFVFGFLVCFLFIVFINFLYYQFFAFKE